MDELALDIVKRGPPPCGMSVESAAISALSAVVAGLCFLFKLLWRRSEECEKWRAEKEPIINELMERLGVLSGVARLVQECQTPSCTFAGKLSETYSLKKKKTHEQAPH